jgi:uncharacterized membrane protein YhiD involved in acid resistance
MTGTEASQFLSDLFNTDITLLESAFNPLQITLSLILTFLMSMFIYYIYKKTYNGVLYSKNFNITLVMTALTVDAIMIGISGNVILSLGMVGALSIVRFRTAVKDPKDTAFLFWAITIGVINGVAYYELSLLASLFIAIVLLILSRRGSNEAAYMLIINYTEGEFSKIEEKLKKYMKSYFVRSDTRKSSIIEKVIEVKIKPNSQEEALHEIRKIDSVENCVLLSSNGEFAE